MKHIYKIKRAALAAALLAAGVTGAQAQSSVTMYGVMDVGIGTFSRSAQFDKRLTKLNTDASSSSILGLRGTEDLGDGLSAIFGLEAAIDPKGGNATGAPASGTNVNLPGYSVQTTQAMWRRGSWVGLKSNTWGTVMLGRNYTATAFPVLVNANGIPNNAVNTGIVTLTAAQGIDNDYWNSNMIRYESPMFGGFNFGANYILGEDTQSKSAGSGYGAYASYATGPFKVGGTYTKDKGGAKANGDRSEVGKSIDWWALSGSYDVGQFRIVSGYVRVQNSDRIAGSGISVAGWTDSKMWTLGGNYAFTPQFRVGMQYGEITEHIHDTKSKQTVVSAHYNLSKRTNLYAMFSHVSNGALPILPTYGNQQGNLFVPNASVNAVVLGMVHRF